MFQVKQFLGETLSLGDHRAKIRESNVIIKTLNKLIGLSMSKT
ncbi:hypothetical protein BTN50_2125 [Candidatus Enterovibrio altilux]|uniref:Mobile element protein n=1 Tax=Candidatus Enterovibrio altilux TaxID=1927128 RepID=A0A291BC18_9GAMM|nr:hypothetical protein BTN50_2125 [Candidatus Enterovibrio luxaltus]